MTRLTELDPHWLMKDGKRVGFVFISPVDQMRKDGTPNPSSYRQTCFPQPTPTRVQHELFEEMFGDNDFLIQGCRPDFGWTIAGGIENASFDTITVTPSLDGSPGGLWHGFITAGEIR